MECYVIYLLHDYGGYLWTRKEYKELMNFKESGLSEEEKEEQQRLRQEYIMAIRNNLRGTLQNVSLLNPDGTVTDLSKKEIKNKKFN